MAGYKYNMRHFAGVRTDVEPHELERLDGECSQVENMRTGTGSLRTRKGISVVKSFGEDKVPKLIISRARTMPTDGLYHENNAVIADNEGSGVMTFLPVGAVFPLTFPVTFVSSEVAPWQSSFSSLQDSAALGNRYFMCDGVNPNAVIDDSGCREMGCQGQRGLTLTEITTGGTFSQDEYYVYGVQRILINGSFRIYSPVMYEGITIADTNNTSQVQLNIDEYEYPVLDGWSVHYRVYRSQLANPEVLYRVKAYVGAVYTQSSDIEVYQAVYTDATLDAELDLEVSYLTQSPESNYPFPSARYIRAFGNRLVMAGGRVTTGTLDAGGAVAVVTPVEDVSLADLDAYLYVTDEMVTFVITKVDTELGTWTLDKDVSAALTGKVYYKVHDADVVRISNALPDNIEGQTIGSEIYTSASEPGSRITGLATDETYLYLLRESRVDVIDNLENPMPRAIPDSQQGCVSHATISDQHSPMVMYYTGHSVVALSAGQSKVISDPVEKYIKSADHSYDAFTHAVYDPVEALYHLWLFRETDHLIPTMLLTFDIHKDQWYTGYIPASRSGVWEDGSGGRYPVVGVLGGIARMDVNTGFDNCSYTGLVTVESSQAINGDSDFGDDALGMPAHIVHADGTVESRIVELATTGTAIVNKAWDSPAEVGERYYVGDIHFSCQPGGEFSFGGKREKLHRVAIEHDTIDSELTCKVNSVRTQKSFSKQLDMSIPVSEIRGASAGFRGTAFQLTLSGFGDVNIVRVHLQAVEVTR